MCDFFSQSWVEATRHDGGDLADIVRASGASGPSTRDPANAATTDHSWQLLLQNDHQPPAAAAAAFPPPLAVDHNFASCHAGGLHDPALLHELSGGALRTSPLSPLAENQSPRFSAGMIKRRKSQAKKVVCIPAAPAATSHGRSSSSSSGEVVPSDLWAWRKYGQKPIKGSPYPRGYYRCSSSKGCSARKQVERSRTDPNMLVITYTSEHNHPWPTQRNALAGSTRSQASRRTSSATTTAATKDETATMSTTTTRRSSSMAIVKEEEEESAGDTEKDEAFDRMFYNEPATDESDDFFAGLAELDSEQMSLVYD